MLQVNKSDMPKKALKSGKQLRKNKDLKRHIAWTGSNKVRTLDKSPLDKSPSTQQASLSSGTGKQYYNL